MAIHRLPQIHFRIQLLSGEIKPITADPTLPLSIVAKENGVAPEKSPFIFYHNGSIINPLYSLSALKINNNDTIICIEKREKKSSKRTAHSSPLTYSPEYVRQTTSASSSQFFDDDYFGPFAQPERAKTRPTIIPPPPVSLSRDPLPMVFPNTDPQQNANFWKSIERRFSIDETN